MLALASDQEENRLQNEGQEHGCCKFNFVFMSTIHFQHKLGTSSLSYNNPSSDPTAIMVGPHGVEAKLRPSAQLNCFWGRNPVSGLVPDKIWSHSCPDISGGRDRSTGSAYSLFAECPPESLTISCLHPVPVHVPVI